MRDGAMNRKLFIPSAVLVLLTSGCAGPNPNPGERTTDIAWTAGNFKRAFEIAKAKADTGEPWAQLRFGIFYENGWGVERNLEKAEYWYRQAAIQTAIGLRVDS